jgi:hypothetical protein
MQLSPPPLHHPAHLVAEAQVGDLQGGVQHGLVLKQLLAVHELILVLLVVQQRGEGALHRSGSGWGLLYVVCGCGWDGVRQ